MNQLPDDSTASWHASLLMPAIMAPAWFAWNASLGVPASLANLTGCVLVPLLVASMYTDVRWKKIPNYMTYSALLWAFGINTVATIASQKAAPEVAERLHAQLGAIGIGHSLLGAVCCFAIMYSFHISGGFGGGDVKIAAAIGALLGFRLGISVLFWCAVSAAIFGVASICWQIGPVTFARDSARRVASLLLPLYFSPPHDRLERLMHAPTPMGFFFVVGATMSLLGYTVL